MAIRNIRRQATNPLAAPGTPTSVPIYVDSDDNILKMIPAGSGTTEVQVIDASTAQTLTTKTLTAPVLSGSVTGTYTLAGTPTFTSPTINTPTVASPVITGDAGSGIIFSKTVLFTEDATSLTHTGTVVIPAGATLIDIIVVPQVLWTGGTVTWTCGDANSANGWFTATNLKATDLILGERLQAAEATRWGGVNGTYLVSATGRFGQQSTNMIGGYCPTAYSVIGVVTVITPATTAGRLRMTVLWSLGQAIAPVLA